MWSIYRVENLELHLKSNDNDRIRQKNILLNYKIVQLHLLVGIEIFKYFVFEVYFKNIKSRKTAFVFVRLVQFHGYGLRIDLYTLDIYLRKMCVI